MQKIFEFCGPRVDTFYEMFVRFKTMNHGLNLSKVFGVVCFFNVHEAPLTIIREVFLMGLIPLGN